VTLQPITRVPIQAFTATCRPAARPQVTLQPITRVSASVIDLINQLVHVLGLRTPSVVSLWLNLID
jgi:hypothetical protein